MSCRPAPGARLDRAVEHDALARGEDVAQKRLVQPDRAQRAALVGDERFENLEAGPPGRAQAATQNPGGDRRRLSGLERGDGLEVAAVFVPDGKPIQQIFDRVQPGVLEIGGAPRSDAFEKLKRRREDHRSSRGRLSRRVQLA